MSGAETAIRQARKCQAFERDSIIDPRTVGRVMPAHEPHDEILLLYRKIQLEEERSFSATALEAIDAPHASRKTIVKRATERICRG
jgi:hypothetical protein